MRGDLAVLAGAAFLLWAAVTAAVLAARLVADRRLARLTSLRQQQDLIAGSRLPGTVAEALALDARVRTAAARTLARDLLARRGTAAVVREARGGHPWRRSVALRLLARAGYPRIDALLTRALDSEDAIVAACAASILFRRGDLAAAGILVQALVTGRSSRSRLAAYLDQYPDPPALLPLLRPLLQHDDPTLRFWAATLMSRHRAAPGLSTRLGQLATRDGDPRVRKAAVASLGRIGGPASAWAAGELLRDPVPFVRAHAARALGRLGRSDSRDVLAGLSRDGDWWVRLAARDALAALDRAGVAAGSALRPRPARVAGPAEAA